MKALVGLLAWNRIKSPAAAAGSDLAGFATSFCFHLVLVLLLALWALPDRSRDSLALLAPQTADASLDIMDEIYFSERPHDELGAVGTVDINAVALSQAQIIEPLSEVPSPVDLVPTDLGRIEINDALQVATGLYYSENLAVKGTAGEGAVGATGAIDRITHEILLSLEERKTLVVWLFDQSGSLDRQRKEIRQRFEQIYEELGVVEAANNPAFAKHDDKPLLTSIVAFGQSVSLLTEQPTDDLSEILGAVEKITMDDSGIENVFSAMYLAVDRYKGHRVPRGADKQPERNVMLIAFTDEVGDDRAGLERTIDICRRYAMPVYVVGVPAPFGREETLVKWVDPDPKYDQTPQWGRVNQGPETLVPERVKLSFEGEYEAPIDSGFGPYALTRLCYETGGIYFAIHPNRNIRRSVSRRETADFTAHLERFFDPEVMRRYRPDYLPSDEYMRRLEQSPLRKALVQAAQLSWVTTLEEPDTRFVKRNEADFANALTEAQKDAARLEPKLIALHATLQQGEEARADEFVPRWQAGYDLAMGTVLAARVRTEGYNAMLALAKRSLPFKDPKNNTWVLEPTDEITVSSQLASAADKSREYLQRVIEQHADTPWAVLAQRELQQPLGWQWTETYTDLAPPRQRVAANNNNPRPPRNDQARRLEKPKRPPPKL